MKNTLILNGMEHTIVTEKGKDIVLCKGHLCGWYEWEANKLR